MSVISNLPVDVSYVKVAVPAKGSHSVVGLGLMCICKLYMDTVNIIATLIDIQSMLFISLSWAGCLFNFEEKG